MGQCHLSLNFQFTENHAFTYFDHREVSATGRRSFMDDVTGRFGRAQCMQSSKQMALHEVTWCMVVWCTQNLRRDGSSFMWHQPCQRLSTPLGWIFNKKTKQKKTCYKKLVTHVESHASAVSLLKRAENSAI